MKSKLQFLALIGQVGYPAVFLDLAAHGASRSCSGVLEQSLFRAQCYAQRAKVEWEKHLRDLLHFSATPPGYSELHR